MNTYFPNFMQKHGETSMISPSDYVEYLKKVGQFPTSSIPRGVILCYQRRLLDHILREHKTSKGDGFLSDMILLDETDGQIGVMGRFGIGAPAAVVVLEELIACGVGRFVSVGTAGTLQKDIQIGDLIVCEKAIRDEGTSHHYLSPSKYSMPSEELTNQMTKMLVAQGQAFRIGVSWTVDAPYRETIAEARHYQSEGVAVVEMEAAALFSVAAYRKAEIASVFTVTDSLADLKWYPDFHNVKAQIGLEALYESAKVTLLSD